MPTRKERAPILLWDGNTAVPSSRSSSRSAAEHPAPSSDWLAHAAPGCRAELRVVPQGKGQALRFEFSLEGHGAWAIARHEGPVQLPEHYVVVLALRGEGGPVELQVKLVDATGANVWWWRRPGFCPAPEGALLVLRRAALDFAWGPAGGGEPLRLGAVEVAVAADSEAGAVEGALVIEALRIEPRPTPAGPLRIHQVRASSALPGHEPAWLVGQRGELGGALGHGAWQPEPGDARPWLELELDERRESGGLVVDFPRGAGPAPGSRLLASDDGRTWKELARDEGGRNTRRWLRSGEAESRFLRLELDAAHGVARVGIVPIELAVSPARHAAALARAAPRGRYPRHLLGEGASWALVGGDGDTRKGLLGEDGPLEVDAESFTLEPFLWVHSGEGRCITWADAEHELGLAEGALPIPWVAWRAGSLRLETTAFADGATGRSRLVLRHSVANLGAEPVRLRLFAALRPFQVTPAWQSLNLAGAVAPITRLERDGARVRVNNWREVVAVSAPDGFGAVRSEEALSALFSGRLPARDRVHCPLGFVQGAFAFDLELAAGGREDVVLAVPLFDATPDPPAGLPRSEAAAWGAARLEAARDVWRRRLADVPIELPPAAAAFQETLRASLGWILANREGPRIQPGPRCYRRSWIRDGALTGMALAEMGFADEARTFLRWYAPFQQEGGPGDGRIPCAVDRHGVDPVPEHDSHGEFVWAVVELFRLTGDRELLGELWPRVRRAADAIVALRAERTTREYRGTPFFGLLPESISHEGYASRPVHSYWDDFFALRGLVDAADAAALLGESPAAEHFAALRDAMRRDLQASLGAAMAAHRIDFVPGSADLGDFDPTSTAIALDPCGEGRLVPQTALVHTFERYWAELEARHSGRAEWDAYTPYEVRNAVAFLRLGWRERALALLEWLVADQRPPAWRQWPEVATRDPRAPRFLGDLPHGWVASSFVRALRRMLVDEDDQEGRVVLAAGVPEAWVREEPGVRLRGLATHFGRLHMSMGPTGDGGLRITLAGDCRPPGGLVLCSPLAGPLREVVVDGRARSAPEANRVLLSELPGEVLLRA